MKVKVVRPSRWDHPGAFPTFEKGTPVIMSTYEDEGFLGWYSCDIEGFKTYVPKVFISNGELLRSYNPTELIQCEGDILEVLEIVNAWLLVANDRKVTGWIPAETVISIT